MINEGFIGVTLFFILSGFILSYSYQEKLNSKQSSISQFYIARIARIYPLHVITLLLSLHFFIINIATLPKLLSNLLLLQAFIPLPDYYFSLNAPSWSISVEMFFYLLFPLLIRLNSFYLLLLSTIFITVKIITSNYSNEFQHAMLYISPLLRLPDFLIGILAYRCRQKLTYVFSFFSVNLLQIFALITLAIFIYFSPYVAIAHRYDIYYIIPMSFLIFSLSINGGGIAQILSNKIIVYLGEASFSLYMTHQLVIRYLVEINERHNIFPIGQFLLLVIITCLAVSLIFYKYIELPSKNLVCKKLTSIINK